jgi:hypothetical protein
MRISTVSLGICVILLAAYAGSGVGRECDYAEPVGFAIALSRDLEEITGDGARVRDVRHLWSLEARDRTSEDADFERQFMLARLRLVGELNMWDSIDEERLAHLIEKAGAEHTSGDGMRGNVGYGFFFNENSHHWTNITAILQKMIIPRTPGGDVYTWLYNTTTNRSNLGVEAFISYNSQSDFHFKVYDWANPSPWQIDMPYSTLGEYIYDEQNADGVWRQLLRVVNITRQHDPNDWTNEVYIYNRFRDTWDLIYLYSYVTTHPTQNTYEPGDFYGSWGPIFETFQDHDGSNKPIGWDDSLIYQDGVRSRLGPGNSWLRVDDPSLTPPIFLVPNSAWAVGTTQGEPADQLFEAEAGTHEIGHAAGEAWVATPAEGEGWMLRGPLWTFPDGRMNAEFLIGVAHASGPNVEVCLLGVWDATTSNYLVSDTLYRQDFVNDRYPHQFRYDFDAVAGHEYEFVVYSHANEAFGVDRVVVVKN